MKERPLAGRVALITGGGSPIGIGRAIAIAYAAAGASVALLDRRPDWLEETVEEVKNLAQTPSVLALHADVSDFHSMENAVSQTIKEFDHIDILVNNAGVDRRVEGGGQSIDSTKFWDVTPDVWARVISINTNGPFYLARLVAPRMVQRGWGRIIGVTTSLDSMWRPGSTPYGPSKAAHEALVSAMAGELDGTGVTANVLVPGGATLTNLTVSHPAYQEDRDSLIRAEVMQAPAVWLASEEAAWFSGRRIIARLWDTEAPLASRIERATAPAAWRDLGEQAHFPVRRGG